MKQLLDRLPGLADSASRRLALAVCGLHLEVRRLRQLRSGTLARLYEDHFRNPGFRPDLFALAVGSDSGGRLGLAERGHEVAREVEAGIRSIQEACSRVDAAELRKRFTDTSDFKRALHEARCQALSGRTPDDGSPP